MEKLLTVKEYADKENLSNSTIYKYIRTGKIDSKIQNGRKYIIDNDSGKIINETIEVVDEKQNLESKISELQEYIRVLEQKNQDLLLQIPLKKQKIRQKVELSEYLINLGITKKERKKIFKRCKKSQDERFQQEDNNIFIDLDKYTYQDMF